MITLDGNEAAARIAHLCNEVIAIYPITPASPMGEFADAWSAQGKPNLWGSVPRIVEMQSEAGAAGAIHGALQAGALTTTFTASQGLLLMLPNMYKIAGELTPCVIHIAARSLAAQALSIFADHSDVMAARATGFAMLCANSVQEAQDFALIAQAATLKGRIPLLHFFDGFRTSHEISKIVELGNDVVRAMIDDELVAAHRARALSPAHPVLRGSSQNPDVYFQARETVNPYYSAFPGIVQDTMDRFAELTGRQYHLFDYVGPADAMQVLVMMGSGAEAAHETVEALNTAGQSVGLLKIRLYRPLDAKSLVDALPKTVERIAVLDRCKEPGSDGEPLFKDVVTALAGYWPGQIPRVIGGRYGLSSKEFTPAMVEAIFLALTHDAPPRQFTVGIHDDVSHLSLDWDTHFRNGAQADNFQAMFYGLGSDGTVSANKNSIKIIGESTELYAQGFFQYDSKKSGAVTISHLRFGPKPIRSTYLIEDDAANFVACHQPVFLERYDMLVKAANKAVFLLNSTVAPDQLWESLPQKMQQQILDKQIQLHVIDAYAVAEKAGMGKRINTIMQTAFFAISGILPHDQAVAAIKHAVEKTYGKRGRRMVEFNFRAIDETLACLHDVPVPGKITSEIEYHHQLPDHAPDFVHEIVVPIMAGKGDELPVSKLPADGSFPLGTAAFEKRNLALEIPVWEPDLCTQCGKCALVCPHGVIRAKAFDKSLLGKAPPSFKSWPTLMKGHPPNQLMSYQVAPEDCTGCSLCVDICPIRDKSNASRKALNMAAQPPLREAGRHNWEFFLTLPESERSTAKTATVPGAMLLQPLFEFSGACEGCGETPYLKLASQLFGDRMLVANATGCSSIYGGNLPTTPWAANAQGRGPAWNNSLFEDNAEFGLGMRLAVDAQRGHALLLLEQLREQIGTELAEAIRNADESNEAGVAAQRARIAELRQILSASTDPRATQLDAIAETLARHSVWIVGGDGWAYDIGYGGLDHVLASGADVNILVLDTEVYSNTGGQTSKATPRGAVAKFSAAGKPMAKKDLARIAMSYENVYVAHVAYGAKDTQTLRAFLEADAYPGTSLIIAYAPCIAHGVDLKSNHRQQQLAVNTGHWPLLRYDPAKAEAGHNPLHLDSKPPSIPYRELMDSETRFSMLRRSQPERAELLARQAEREIQERYHRYQQLAELSWEQEESEDSGSKDHG